MSEWLPIETAPRDGTSILCCDARMPIPAAVCQWVVYQGLGEPVWKATGEEYSLDATHWMPLPVPPKPLDPQPKIG